jgi:hypothetical protein
MFNWFRRRVSRRDLLKVIDWFGCGDTGMSSKALAIYLSGVERATGYWSYPHDGGDLGRCIRFLRHMGWEHRIGEMATASKPWAVLAANWRELTRLYDERDAALYDRMREILARVEKTMWSTVRAA